MNVVRSFLAMAVRHEEAQIVESVRLGGTTANVFVFQDPPPLKVDVKALVAAAMNRRTPLELAWSGVTR
jgi:hypothetical protein